MKTYKLVVSFGDGKPQEATVIAKCGADAHDKGFCSFPAARSVRVVGVCSPGNMPPLQQGDINQSQHPLFGHAATPMPCNTPRAVRVENVIQNKQELLDAAIVMRHNGILVTQIAKMLDVGETTLRRWLKPPAPKPVAVAAAPKPKRHVPAVPSDTAFY